MSYAVAKMAECGRPVPSRSLRNAKKVALRDEICSVTAGRYDIAEINVDVI